MKIKYVVTFLLFTTLYSPTAKSQTTRRDSLWYLVQVSKEMNLEPDKTVKIFELEKNSRKQFESILYNKAIKPNERQLLMHRFAVQRDSILNTLISATEYKKFIVVQKQVQQKLKEEYGTGETRPVFDKTN